MSDAVTLGSLLRLAVSLGVIIGLLLLVRRWALRGSGSVRGVLRVVARVPLGRSTSMAVVALGDQHYLVGVGEDGVTLIDRVDDPVQETSPSRERAPVAPGPARSPLVSGAMDGSRPGTGLVERMRRMTLRAPGRLRGDALDL